MLLACWKPTWTSTSAPAGPAADRIGVEEERGGAVVQRRLLVRLHVDVVGRACRDRIDEYADRIRRVRGWSRTFYVVEEPSG